MLPPHPAPLSRPLPPYPQARDNVKFLATLERHFRAIAGGPLGGILDTLPLLLNALRMVWIISRYYSDDGHMGSLFARVAADLCDRVDGAVLLHTLFRMPAFEATELLRVSKAVLESWQANYMQVGVAGVWLVAAGVERRQGDGHGAPALHLRLPAWLPDALLPIPPASQPTNQPLA